MSEHFIFTGERDDVHALFSLMDVFVLPSHREGLPRTPMEASAMSVPCIVTDVRGCREVVTMGDNGLIVPPNNVSALVDSILTLLENESLAHHLGENGRVRAEKQFDERIVFARVKDVYADLLQQNGLSPPSTS